MKPVTITRKKKLFGIMLVLILTVVLLVSSHFYLNRPSTVYMTAREWDEEFESLVKCVYEGRRRDFPSLKIGDTVKITGNITSVRVVYPSVDITLDGYEFPLPFAYNLSHPLEVGDNVTITLKIVRGAPYSLFSYEEDIGFEGDYENGGFPPSIIEINNPPSREGSGEIKDP